MLADMQIPFDGETKRQANGLQLGEHQIAPLPFVDAAVSEQPPVVAFSFSFGNEPRSTTAGVEILDKNLCIQPFAILRANRMFLEFRDNLFS